MSGRGTEAALVNVSPTDESGRDGSRRESSPAPAVCRRQASSVSSRRASRPRSAPRPGRVKGQAESTARGATDRLDHREA